MGIEVKNLSYSYKNRENILNDISFSVEQGEYLCLLGPNGVGKSTLFKCMMGLLPGYRGEIRLDGEEIRTLSPRQLAKKAAYIPQSTGVSFSYSVEEMVLMGTTPQMGRFASPGKRERQAAWRALEKLHIESLAGRVFSQLSGGERQLVLIARALAQGTRLLIMDEPTSSLDYGNQLRVMQRVQALARQGYMILLSSHNPQQALLFADRILALHDGAILADGAPREVITPALLQTLYGIATRLADTEEGRLIVPLLKEDPPCSAGTKI